MIYFQTNNMIICLGGVKMNVQNSQLIIERIMTIVSSIINLEESINPSSNLNEYGINSMKQMEIIVNIEMEFDFEFSDEDLLMTNFETIDKIVLLLEQKYLNQG